MALAFGSLPVTPLKLEGCVTNSTQNLRNSDTIDYKDGGRGSEEVGRAADIQNNIGRGRVSSISVLFRQNT
jgi:hypothetical protein